MDFLNYMLYHYIDETPDWVKRLIWMEPKPIDEILVDIFMKIVLISLVIFIFYWGIRLLFYIWPLQPQLQEEKEHNLLDLKDLPENEHQLEDDIKAAKEMPAMEAKQLDSQNLSKNKHQFEDDNNDDAKEIPSMGIDQLILQNLKERGYKVDDDDDTFEIPTIDELLANCERSRHLFTDQETIWYYPPDD